MGDRRYSLLKKPVMLVCSGQVWFWFWYCGRIHALGCSPFGKLLCVVGFSGQRRVLYILRDSSFNSSRRRVN